MSGGWWSTLKARCRTRAFKDATTEVAVTVVTATLPIWFFPSIALFLGGPSFSMSLLDHSISNGEFFLFCTSLVGPLIYILFRIYEVPDAEPHHFKYRISLVFPHGLKFAALIFFICVISSVIFGLQKINPKFSDAEINKSGYISLSIILFVISVAGFLIAIFFRNEMDSYSPSETMRKEEDEFAKQFKSEEQQ